MIKQENGVTNKKEVVADKKDAEAENTESKAHIPRARKESDSYGNQLASLKGLWHGLLVYI